RGRREAPPRARHLLTPRGRAFLRALGRAPRRADALPRAEPLQPFPLRVPPGHAARQRHPPNLPPTHRSAPGLSAEVFGWSALGTPLILRDSLRGTPGER